VANQWWVIGTIGAGGSGDQIVQTVRESATKPSVGGDVEWVVGPFGTEAAADANAGIGQPSNVPTGGGTLPPGATYTGSSSDLETLEQDLEKFVKTIGSAAFWFRALKVVAGSVLVLMGINKLTGASGKLEQVVKAVK
jgi:hypothetical protein